MTRRRTLGSGLLVAAVLSLAMGGTSAFGGIVNDASLLVWLDAADYDNDGNPGLGSGTAWSNKAATGATHDATLTKRDLGGSPSVPTWGGTGTWNPYHLEFRHLYDDAQGGYAVVANSGAPSALDTQVFTYEVWARRNGAGSLAIGSGALIAHSGNWWGNGGIYWSRDGYVPVPADSFYHQGGPYPPSPTPYGDAAFPNSAGDFTTIGYNHIAYTRSGSGANDTAYYLDGVLQGTFQSNSETSGVHPLGIGARTFAGGNTGFFMDYDLATARVYDRPLIEAEIVQNFDAEKSRFRGIAHAPPKGGLQLWLKADAGVVTDGAGVNTWQDQSGVNGLNDATQSNDGLKPQLTTAPLGAWENHPVVRFDGGDALGFTLPDADEFDDFSVFVLASRTDPHNDYEMVLGSGGSVGGSTPGIRWAMGMGKYSGVYHEGLGWQAGGAGQGFGDGNTLTDDTFLVVSWVRDNGVWTVREGSTVVGGNSGTTFPTGDFNGVIGAERIATPPDYAFSGDIVEILVYDRAITDLDFLQLQQYFFKRMFVIPEPSSLLLLTLGLVSMVGCGWRKRPK